MGHTPTGQTRDKVFQFVRARLRVGQPPTVREVQAAFGFKAVRTARQHLEQLVLEGRLNADRNKARGYRLPGLMSTTRAVLVPLLGRVTAGVLQEAIEDPDGYISVDSQDGAGTTELFALRVQGESMTGVGIFPGDVVLVRRQPTARDGDVVVALVEDEATIKTFKLNGRLVELRPANPTFTSIVIDAEQVIVLGKVIEVRRTLA